MSNSTPSGPVHSIPLRLLRLDPDVQPRVGTDEAVVAEYAELMRGGATFPAVTVFHDGATYYVADGFHRVLAAQATGAESVACDVFDGEKRDAILYALGANADHGLRRTNADKRRAVERLLADPEWSQWSDREIARRCRVTQPFVSRVRSDMTDNGYQSSERTYTDRWGNTSTMDVSGLRREGSDGADFGQRVVEWASRVIEDEPEYMNVEREQRSQETPARLAVHFTSDSPEWYTPKHIVERVARTMDGIDLDPCSNSHDDPNVPALRHFTIDDDGLSRDWSGRVYMNPPYGREIVAWVEKLVAEHQSGRVTEAVALVPARTDTAWFRTLDAEYFCFVAGRLTFSEHESAAPFPSVAVYLGANPEAFIAAFRDVGAIYRRLIEQEAA